MTRQVFLLNSAGGIALAVSLSSVFQLGILYALWNKRSRNYGSREVYSFYLNMLLISALLGIGLEWFKDLLQGWFDGATLSGNLAIAALVGTVSTAVFFGIGRVVHIKEIDELLKKSGLPGSGFYGERP
jgi:peptidoglycan biosynthesis protein MviN/MurJ (putative lipid II flippase)